METHKRPFQRVSHRISNEKKSEKRLDEALSYFLFTMLCHSNSFDSYQ